MFKRVIFILCFISIILSQVFAATDNTMDAKRAIFAQIDSKNLAAVDTAIAQFKTTYSKDPGLVWALVHISEYLYEKGETQRASDLRNQIIAEYPNSEQAKAIQLRILSSDIAKMIESGNIQSADAAIKKMCSDYYTGKDDLKSALPWRLDELANLYDFLEKYDKAIELRSYISTNFSEDIPVVKTAIVKLMTGEIISLIDNKRIAEADKKLADFIGKYKDAEGMATRLREIANKLQQRGYTKRSTDTRQMIIEKYNKSVDARVVKVQNIGIQMEILFARGDYKDVNNKIEQLCKNYSDVDILPATILEVADRYRDIGSIEDANSLCTKVLKSFADSAACKDAQLRIILIDTLKSITAKDITRAKALVSKMQSDFVNNPMLPKFLCEVVDSYCAAGQTAEGNALRSQVNLKYANVFEVGKMNFYAKNGEISRLMDSNDYDKAYNELSRLLADSRQQANAHLWIILTYAEKFDKLGQTDRANTIYLALISNYPDNLITGKAVIDLYKVNTFIEEGNYDQAKKAIGKIKYDYKGKVAQSALLFAAEEYYFDGRRQEQNSETENSAESYKQALEIFDNKELASVEGYWGPDTSCIKAEMYRKVGRFQDSINLFSEILEKYPEYKYATVALNMVVCNYKDMVSKKMLTEEQAMSKLEKIHDSFAKKTPDSQIADVAKIWKEYDTTN